MFIRTSEITKMVLKLLVCATLYLLGSCQKAENNIDVKVDFLESENQNISENFGLVNFGSYSVYIASGNKTVKEIANDLGINYKYLSNYNGMSHFFKPENGTILAIPSDFKLENITDKNFDIEKTQKIISSNEQNRKAEKNIDSFLIHTVKQDETVFKIARSYKISVKAISDRNNLTSEFLIYPGQELKIPIFADTSSDKNDNFSAAINFKDEASFNSPKRPKVSSELYGASSTSVSNSFSNLHQEKQVGLFPPVVGEIVKSFNLSAGSIRNEGIDIKVKKGAFVYSADDGMVMLVSKSAGEKLRVVIIKHQNNILTIYAGLSSVDYKKGDAIKKGAKIGKVNEINNILHFEIRKGNKPLDPHDLFVFSNKN